MKNPENLSNKSAYLKNLENQSNKSKYMKTGKSIK